jgi:Tfp pilus assembly protein PilF
LSVWQSSAHHHFEAARCAWREADLVGAEQHLRQASRRNWPGQAVEIESVFIRAQLGPSPNTESALKEIIQIGKKDPNTKLLAPALEALELSLLRAGRYLEAEMPARILVKEFPDSWRSHWLLGRALEKPLPDAAFEAYERSLELKPDQPKVHFWLAQFHAENGRPKEAHAHLQKSNRDRAEDGDTWMVRARIAYRQADWPAARKALDQALRAGVARPGPALALRGLVELEEDSPQEAAIWLAKAQARSPNDIDVIDALAALATRQGDQKKMKHYQERRGRFQEQAASLADLQKTLVELQNQPKSDPAEMRALAFKIGAAMFDVGIDDQAVHWMTMVLRQEPNHPAAHQALAEYYERIDEPEKAKAHRGQAGK